MHAFGSVHPSHPTVGGDGRPRQTPGQLSVTISAHFMAVHLDLLVPCQSTVECIRTNDNNSSPNALWRPVVGAAPTAIA